MSVEYLQVAEEENEEAIELPLEKDGTMLLTTVKGVFPGACGMKFRNPETNAVRGVRLSDGGVLHPPSEGWDTKSVYVCVFPLKRKMDDSADSDRSVKTKRLEKKLACSDLICLGLPWKSTEESVRQYFEQFGEVVMVQLKKDASGSFKGFGFIRFGTYTSQMRALAQRHNIDGRWVDVRIPNSKEGLVPQMPCKVFVGRCTEDISADDLREYFTEFGEVTDVFVPRPFRAFAFVTFLDPEVAQSLCGEDHVIKGVSVSVSSAAPKIKAKPGYRDAGPSGPGPQGNWSRNGNANNPNFDSLNLQNLGINSNGPPTANVNVPISLVAAALNAGLLGPGGGQQGGPGWNGGWQGAPPGQQGKGWGGQGQGWGGQGQGWGGQGGKGWNQGGGGGGGSGGNSWPQQQAQGSWTQSGPAPPQWNNNKT